MNQSETIHEQELLEHPDILVDAGWSLVLLNDDVTPYDYVIESLINVCRHNIIQAEQCTWIAHHKGKAKIKSGDFEEMAAMKDALNLRGIMCDLEPNVS